MSPNFASLFLLASSTSAPVDTVRQSLENSSEQWFHCLVWSSIIVGIGVALEGPEATIALKRWYRHWRGKEVGQENPKSWVIPASYVGFLLVILGVLGEGVFEYLSSNVETALRAHDEQVLADTISEAGAAKDSANTAAADAKTAGEQSRQATISAGSARTLAAGARQEADALTQEVKDAKQESADASSKAADAVSRLADAESRLLDATQREAAAEQRELGVEQELARIRTPRSLTDASALTESLRAFKGTEYIVVGCFQDQDSIDLLVQIDKALSDAGWVRGKLPESSSGIDIHLNISKDFAVPLTTRTGVAVGAQSTETLEKLQATPMPLLPAYIRAAMALKGGLATGINPQEGDFGPLGIDPGTSTSVFILVGKKP